MSEIRDEERTRTGHEPDRIEDETPQSPEFYRDEAESQAASDGASAETGHGRGDHAMSGAGEGTGPENEEVEVLRTELSRLQSELHDVRGQLDEMRDRFLRARADLENYRRRAASEVDRAREAGLDSAVLPLLSVFDDLNRALEAATTADPGQIVPGVQAVLATLERNLDNLGIQTLGAEGERFDPDVHEALTTVPTEEPGKSETIAQVFQVGFQKGDRLIRPARVVVYQGEG